jgi:hypothetical protein
MEGCTVELPNAAETIVAVGEPNDRNVQVTEREMRIHDLCIERPAIIAYLQTIPPSKQTIALVHALEVGVTEMIARRERFRPSA